MRHSFYCVGSSVLALHLMRKARNVIPPRRFCPTCTNSVGAPVLLRTAATALSILAHCEADNVPSANTAGVEHIACSCFPRSTRGAPDCRAQPIGTRAIQPDKRSIVSKDLVFANLLITSCSFCKIMMISSLRFAGRPMSAAPGILCCPRTRRCPGQRRPPFHRLASRA